MISNCKDELEAWKVHERISRLVNDTDDTDLYSMTLLGFKLFGLKSYFYTLIYCFIMIYLRLFIYFYLLISLRLLIYLP